MDPWEVNWELVPNQKPRSGGQGSVVLVRSRTNGRLGALKTMHDRHLRDTERRYRMQQEVYALRVIRVGVPQVMESNIEQWQDLEVRLYVVMEWIDGPTLSEYVSKMRMLVEEGVECARRLLDIIEASHAVSILHRDLKPDNIILRNGDPADPVLVDFGIAWADRGETEPDFETELGQELGNRFLRLPEFAPGRRTRVPHSDVTFVAGLLLYMVTGRAPRLLRDERDRAPHDSVTDGLLDVVSANPKWARLRRVFDRAFQPSLDLRYSAASDLRDALASLDKPVELADPFPAALERLRDVAASDRVRRLHDVQDSVQRVCEELASETSVLGGKAGFAMPGGHGFDDTGKVYRVGFGLQRPGTSGGTVVRYNHEVHISDTELVARYSVGSRPPEEYYRGSIVDIEGLREAIEVRRGVLMTELVDEYARRIQGIF
jgi:serine/threonine protein kinase